MKRSAFALIIVAGCLDPSAETIDVSRRFGDPNIQPTEATHVEDDPLLANNVKQFSRRVVYLNGFAEGDAIRYWNVDGPNATFIAPMYQIVGPNGPIGRPIIDVLPGDTGYTPWWREVFVRTTSKYNGERIWSRDAIDAGISVGILEVPEDQPNIKNCPVIQRSARIPVDLDKSVDPTWGWYRNERVSWVDFSDRLPLETSEREMPNLPVYVVQRINSAEPIYEFLINVDLNHDGDLDDTNNIFGAKPGHEGYSPLWHVSFVRTVADYPSFDTNTSTIGLTAERQFLSPAGEIISTLVVPNGIIDAPDFLVNCSIQRVRGEL